jgi:hypothetical protein
LLMYKTVAIRTGVIFMFLLALAGVSAAQSEPRNTPTPTLVFHDVKRDIPIAAGSNLYCAGFVQTGSINTNLKIVGAHNEQDGFLYKQGDFVYINGGSGLNVGDMFSVVRPRGRVETPWTKKNDLGFYVQEVGAVEIVRVNSGVAVARVKTSCDDILLGDLLEPFEKRTSPMFRTRPALDLFGEGSGKAGGRIFMARDNRELIGREQIVYVDLGSEDNVQPGDYLTIYRPLGAGNLFDKNSDETVTSRSYGYESDKYRGGKYSNQASRKQGDHAQGSSISVKEAKQGRPGNIRKVVGEAVVLSVHQKTATVVVTRTAQEIHTGDRVEVQ